MGVPSDTEETQGWVVLKNPQTDESDFSWEEPSTDDGLGNSDDEGKVVSEEEDAELTARLQREARHELELLQSAEIEVVDEREDIDGMEEGREQWRIGLYQEFRTDTTMKG